MTTPGDSPGLGELPTALRRSFAPLAKTAFGLGLGAVSGGTLFLVTAYHLVARPAAPEGLQAHPFEGDPVGHLWLLENFFLGYDPVTWGGALAGLAWGLALGFALGFAIAGLRNAFLSAWLRYLRLRGNLTANRDFLDQI